MHARTLRLIRAAALALVALAMFEIALNPTPASAVVVEDTPASTHGVLAGHAGANVVNEDRRLVIRTARTTR